MCMHQRMPSAVAAAAARLDTLDRLAESIGLGGRRRPVIYLVLASAQFVELRAQLGLGPQQQRRLRRRRRRRRRPWRRRRLGRHSKTHLISLLFTNLSQISPLALVVVLVSLLVSLASNQTFATRPPDELQFESFRGAQQDLCHHQISIVSAASQTTTTTSTATSSKSLAKSLNRRQVGPSANNLTSQLRAKSVESKSRQPRRTEEPSWALPKGLNQSSTPATIKPNYHQEKDDQGNQEELTRRRDDQQDYLPVGDMSGAGTRDEQLVELLAQFYAHLQHLNDQVELIKALDLSKSPTRGRLKGPNNKTSSKTTKTNSNKQEEFIMMQLGADQDSLLSWLQERQKKFSSLKNVTFELINERPNKTINVCLDGPKILVLPNVTDILYCYTADQWLQKLWFDLRLSSFHYPIIILNILIFLFGTTGNIFVCLSVKRNYQLRSVTNYFIVNLAFADFLVILICLPATVVWDLSLTWFFDTIPCKLIMYLQDVSISVSVLTLTAISIDRYYAICHPLRFKTNLSQAKRMIALIWLVSILIMMPDLIYLSAHRSQDLTEAGLDTVLYSDCNYDWSEGASRAFQFVKTVLLYFLPFLLMFVAHYKILKVLSLASSMATDELQSIGPINATAGRENHTNGQPTNRLLMMENNSVQGDLDDNVDDNREEVTSWSPLARQNNIIILSNINDNSANLAAEQTRPARAQPDNAPANYEENQRISASYSGLECNIDEDLEENPGDKSIGSSDHSEATHTVVEFRPGSPSDPSKKVRFIKGRRHEQINTKATENDDNKAPISAAPQDKKKQKRRLHELILLRNSLDLPASNKTDNNNNNSRQETEQTQQKGDNNNNNNNKFKLTESPPSFTSEHDLQVTRLATTTMAPAVVIPSEKFILTMHNKNRLESRRKAAKMLTAIVILFGICYLPVHLINFLRQFIDDIPQTDVTSSLSMLAHCVCYLNSAINPIIYNHMNSVFRAEFKKFLSCLDWRRKEEPHQQAKVELGCGHQLSEYQRKYSTFRASPLPANKATPNCVQSGRNGTCSKPAGGHDKPLMPASHLNADDDHHHHHDGRRADGLSN